MGTSPVTARTSSAAGLPRGSVYPTAMSTAQGVVATGSDDADSIVPPRVPLPEIIVSNVPGSWAYDTMV